VYNYALFDNYSSLMKNSNNLNHLAVKVENSIGRLISEKTSNTRSEFQRDRDRIIHSTAFRRLKHKTQVFVSHEGDHYRTRLTHSLEVSQIARSIAKIFSLNEDLTETLALAHDIGHPPFGHAGEDALQIAMKSHQGFNHNDQAIRIVHQLEKKYFDFDGLNLTWESLEGLVKHNGPLIELIPSAIKSLNDEFDLKLKNYSSLEAQIAAIADDIAYNNHDIDDGLRAGFFNYDDLRELPLVGEIISTLPNNFDQFEVPRINNEITRRSTSLMVDDVINSIIQNIALFKIDKHTDVREASKQVVVFSDNMAHKVETIRVFLKEKMYQHSKINIMSGNANKVVLFLFEMLKSDQKISNIEGLKSDINNPNHHRVVCDFIAGMTDNFAQSMYNKYS
jgi:dGTPase